MTERERAIPRRTITQMVSVIDETWSVREAELATGGNLSVYHLTVETPSGTRECVLKATPDEGRHGIDTEARLLSVLDAHTTLPVPDVVGAVDVHDDLPAPFFIMESMSGTKVPRRDVGQLSDGAVERLARQTGSYLAELHDVHVPEKFGRIDFVSSRPVHGARPPTDRGQLTVAGFQGSASASDTWPAVVRAWTEAALDRHATTRFGDLTPEIRPVALERLESLSGPFRPVVGRIDHGLHNLLLDAETGAITGMIDWAFTLAVPAAYDLACIEANLSREPWSMLPTTPNRRPLIRKTMLAAYRERGQRAVIDRFYEHHPLYELLALVRAMNNLDASMSGATEEQLDATSDAYRRAVTRHL